MAEPLSASHAIVCRAPQETPLGYFGWPTAARLDDGKLVVGASGFRAAHICPFGKTVLWESADQGRSWSAPRILNDSAADDRDVGITPLPGGGCLVSWFTSDIRQYRWYEPLKPYFDILDAWDDVAVARAVGSFVRRIDADGNAGPVVPVLVSAPHGPIRRADGSLFYLGTRFGREQADGSIEFKQEYLGTGDLAAIESCDGGMTWRTLGVIPDDPEIRCCEPHALELPSGRILGAIRSEKDFSTWLFHSDDGGRSWSRPEKVIASGSPPHLLRHSSGAVILTYGYRREPFGQRAILSHDDGVTWSGEWIIRDDGPDGDLGYPSTVELDDGSLLTVCYQRLPEDRLDSVLSSRWRLPG